MRRFSSFARRARTRPAEDGRTYRAFISYSHSADGKLAPALQSSLQQFAKPWYRLRAIHVFRDDSTLAVTDRLWTSIAQALASSDFFIILASPPAASSEWVGREVSFWLEQRSVERLLLAQTEGELVWSDADGRFDAARSTALPPQLVDAFAEEPRWVDLRFARGTDELSLNHPQFSDAVADLAARLHGRPKDEIAGEEVRQHRRRIRIARSAATALLVLAVGATVLGLVARDQRDEARAQRDLAQSRSFAIQSRTSLSGKRLADAFGLAVTAYDRHPTTEARDAVLAALNAGVRLITMRRGPRATAAAFSSDGRMLAVAAESGAIGLWDLTRRERTRTLASRAPPVTGLAFAPDGRRLAADHDDGTLTVWDLDRPEASPVVVTPSSRRPIGGSIAYGPGPVVAWSVGRVNVAVWRDDGGVAPEVLTTSTFFSQQPWNVAVSSDGATIAAGGQDNGDLLFVPTLAVGELDGPPLHQNAGSGVHSIAFISHTPFVVVGQADGNVSVWDASTQTRFSAPRPSLVGVVEDISVAPAAPRLLLFGTRGVGLASLVGEAEQADVFPSYSSDLGGAFVDKTGTAATVGRDGVIAFWKLAGERLQLGRTLAAGGFSRVAFSDDGSRVAAAGTDGLRVWSVPSGKLLLSKPLTESSGAVAFGADGRTVLVGGDVRGGVVGWSADSGRPLDQPLADRGDGLSVFAIGTRDGRPVAAVGSAFTRAVIAASKISGIGAVSPGKAGQGTPMRLWAVSREGDLGTVPVPHPDDLRDAWLSDDGKRLATLAAGELIVWDTKSKARLVKPQGSFDAAAFSEDGQEIVGARVDGIGVWSADSPRRIGAMFAASRGPWRSVVVGSGGRIVAAANTLGEIRLWDYASRRPLGQVSLYEGGPSGSELPALAISDDGKRLVAVNRLGQVVLFDIDPESWVARACRLGGLDVDVDGPKRCR